MIITPQPHMAQLKIDEMMAGVLNTSSRESAVECAEIIALGEEVDGLEIGDKVFVKSWAIDIITHDDVRYYFVDINSNGILAKIA